MKIPYKNGDIPALLNYPTKSGLTPAIMIVHGFTGSKEGDLGKFSRMAEYLNKLGFATLQFDFCGCGENESPMAFYNINRLLDECTVAYEFLLNQKNIDPNKITAIGHSLGARIVSLLCNKLNFNALVLLNGALGNKYRTPWWLKEELYRIQEECKYEGKSAFVSSGGQNLYLYQEFFTSLEKTDVDRSLKAYEKPLLIVYGTTDPSVDPRVSIETYDIAQGNVKKLVAIEDANHTFNAKTGDFTKLDECIGVVGGWLNDVYFQLPK